MKLKNVFYALISIFTIGFLYQYSKKSELPSLNKFDYQAFSKKYSNSERLKNTAVNYMKLRGDLWSTTSTGAYKVARLAGGLRGGKFQPPIADRAHGAGNFAHYHTWNRSGGHSFYGVASNK